MEKIDKIFSYISDFIVKHKLKVILGIPITIYFVLLLLKNTLFKGISIFDWFSQIIGFVSFAIGILVLDSVTLKEKMIESEKRVRKRTNIDKSINESLKICEMLISQKTTYGNFVISSSHYLYEHSELLKHLKFLKSNEIVIDDLDTLSEYLNKSNEEWYKSEKSFISYIRIIEDVKSELFLIQHEMEDKNINDRMEREISNGNK